MEWQGFIIDKFGYRRAHPWHCCGICPDNNNIYDKGRCVNESSYETETDRYIRNTTYVFMTGIEGCCYFCGKTPSDYMLSCASSIAIDACPLEQQYCKRNLEKATVSEIEPSMRCFACTAFVSVIKEVKNEGIGWIKDQLRSYCRLVPFFSADCYHLLADTVLATILEKLSLNELKPTAICKQYGLCSEDQGNSTAKLLRASLGPLEAPRSRLTILSPNDGPVMPPGSLEDLAEFNYERLLTDHLGDESPEGVERTLKFLARYGLIANTALCRDCQGHQASLVKYAQAPEGLTWRCNNCRKAMETETSSRMSIRIGSFFDNSHLTIKQILRLAYWWAQHPTSKLETVMRENEISSRMTIIDFYNFLRDLCQAWVIRLQEQERLGGMGRVVEIDESKFFRAKYNRGRMLQRQYDWVFGMLERGSNKVRFFPVAARDAATLLPLIADNIEPGTLIVSDGWAAYGGIQNMQQRYDHRWVNHRVFFVDPQDRQVHTQGIEATWGALKTSLRHLRGSNEEMLPTYLFQYMFRRYHGNAKIFQHILEEMRLNYPV
ncbi:hypothetical protein niasHT_003476 [Heterodera trifolii]|uniref:Saposin B-type domain-containing protein n=1 Tax=Heterodera trifolii TaxID=157864 RepID=A0ABD2LVH3_9BILA